MIEADNHIHEAIATYPMPWQIAYDRRFESWDERSSPRVVDAVGKVIFCPPPSQGINHPGEFDRAALGLCKLFLRSQPGQ